MNLVSAKQFSDLDKIHPIILSDRFVIENSEDVIYIIENVQYSKFEYCDKQFPRLQYNLQA